MEKRNSDNNNILFLKNPFTDLNKNLNNPLNPFLIAQNKINNENKEKNNIFQIKKDTDANNINNTPFIIHNKDLKNYENKTNKNNYFLKNPEKLEYFETLVKEAFNRFPIDNHICVFKSINNILTLVYSKRNAEYDLDFSIKAYNIVTNQIMSVIKNLLGDYILNLRHFLDKINKRDLIISVFEENKIKIWNLKNCECIIELKDINKNGQIYSAYCLNNNNINYIITSHMADPKESEGLKIFDFNKKKIGEIRNSNDTTVLVETYYDNKLCKNYILTGNKRYVKSFDFDKKELYYKYVGLNRRGYHNSIIIRSNENKTELIGSCDDGNIRIWDFHSGFMIKEIEVFESCAYGICLWDMNHLFVGSVDKQIKLVNLNTSKIIKIFENKNHNTFTIKKVIHPKFGESLITFNYNGTIKLWSIK